MRQLFFYAMAVGAVVAIGGWALYMVGRAIWQLFQDWKLGRELDEIQSQIAQRREERVQARAERLANGCEHDFNASAVGLPPSTCPKCGLERVKPDGACDHIWRVKSGPVPTSECEQCGKVYHPLQSSSGLPQR